MIQGTVALVLMLWSRTLKLEEMSSEEWLTAPRGKFSFDTSRHASSGPGVVNVTCGLHPSQQEHKTHAHLAWVIVPEFIVKPVGMGLFAFNFCYDIKNFRVGAARTGAVLIRLTFGFTGTF